MKEGRLAEKVAIVTGSTSGIGEATVKLFAKEGAKVVVAGRRAEKGQRVAAEIVAAGGEAIFVQTDVVKDEQVYALVDATLKKYGQIDIMVNNAGKLIEKPFLELTKEDWDNFVALDGRSYFVGMQAVLPHMLKRNYGSIVNITSHSAVKPTPKFALYCFAKAGVTHASKAIALEYADKGIRVNCILSGATLTEMTEGDLEKNEFLKKTIPMRRISSAEEQAYAALFLASDEASYLTGASIQIDGGDYPV